MKRVFPGLLLFALLAILACHAPVPEGYVEITFIDVGHGSAVLIRTSDQRACLIDGGPTYAGANDVCPLLDSLGITELDYCIATNYTPERVGGLDEVIRWLGGEEGVLYRCFDRGGVLPSTEFAEYAATAGSRRTRMRIGEQIEMGEVSIWCMAINGRVLGEKAKPVTAEEDKSIALLVSYGKFDMLIGSDLTSVAGGGRYNLGTSLAEASDEVEMLVVGGGAPVNSLGPHMMENLNPVVSIIPVGANDDSLPSQTVVNRLTRHDRKVYQTDRTGWDLIPSGKGRIVGGNIRVTVYRDYYVVAGDTFRTYR
jgi:competence protein ComEC